MPFPRFIMFGMQTGLHMGVNSGMKLNDKLRQGDGVYFFMSG